MTKPRIYADFLKLDDIGRLILITRGSLRDLAGIGANLHSPINVVFYSDDVGENDVLDELEVDGMLLYDDEAGHWVGVFDPTGFRHASDRR